MQRSAIYRSAAIAPSYASVKGDRIFDLDIGIVPVDEDWEGLEVRRQEFKWDVEIMVDNSGDRTCR